jgi:hypothetical protein
MLNPEVRTPEVLRFLRAMVKAAKELSPLGDLSGLGTLALVTLVALAAPGLGYLALRRWVRARYGACLVGHDQLVFRLPTAFRPRWVAAPIRDAETRREVPGGLQVRAGGQWLLIPTDGPSEVRELHALLDAHPDPDTTAGLAWTARPGPRYWALSLLFLAGLAPFALGFAGSQRLRPEHLSPLIAIGVIAALPVLLLLRRWALRLTPGRLHLGRDGLVVGRALVPYGDVLGLTQVDDTMHLELLGLGQRGLLLDGDAEQVDELLRPRCPRLQGPASPPRRSGFLLAAAPLVVWAGLVLFSAPPIYGAARLHDPVGNQVTLVYRLADGRPRALILDSVPNTNHRSSTLEFDTITLRGLWTQRLTPGGTSREIDLLAGTALDSHLQRSSLVQDANLLISGPEGLTSLRVDLPNDLSGLVPDQARLRTGGAFPTTSLPEELARAWAEAPRAPLVDDYLTGRTSRRAYDVDDGRLRLVWGVDHGEVMFVIVAPADFPFGVELAFQSGHWARYVLRRAPGHLNIKTALYARILPGGLAKHAPIDTPWPNMDALLDLTDRIQAGESIESASQETLAPLWDASIPPRPIVPTPPPSPPTSAPPR